MSTRKAFFLGGLAVFLVLVLAFVLIGVFVPSSEDEIASVGEIPTTVPVPTAMPRMTLNPTATIAPIPTTTTVHAPLTRSQNISPECVVVWCPSVRNSRYLVKT